MAQEGAQGVSDEESWLNMNNLGPLTQIFKERSITLDELQEIVEFGEEELAVFASELSDDVTIQQNLITAAKKLDVANNDNQMAAPAASSHIPPMSMAAKPQQPQLSGTHSQHVICLLYTSDAADD